MFRRKKNDGEDDKGTPEVPEELGIPMKPGVKRPAGAAAPTRPTMPTPTPARPLEMTRPNDTAIRPSDTPRFEPMRRVAESPPPPAPAPMAEVPAPEPASAPAPAPVAAAAEPEVEMRRLIVGREISLSGEITSCDRLVVEGSVEANLANCRDIDIAESGLFKGSASIEEAEIRGRFEGTLNVRRRLLIRSTGRVIGTVRYGQIEIEIGGQISGDVQAQPVDQRAPEQKSAEQKSAEHKAAEHKAGIERPTFDRPLADRAPAAAQSPIRVSMAEAKH
jgi:cytoskeletal protein CcmA (bactofilin family)